MCLKLEGKKEVGVVMFFSFVYIIILLFLMYRNLCFFQGIWFDFVVKFVVLDV